MIDGAIVMIEKRSQGISNAAPPDKPRLEVLIEAASEGRSRFVFQAC